MKHDRMGIFLLQYLKNGALSLTGVNCYEFRLSVEAAQGKLKGIQLLVPRLPAFMRKIEPYFPYERSFAHKIPELAKLIVGMQFRAQRVQSQGQPYPLELADVWPRRSEG